MRQLIMDQARQLESLLELGRLIARDLGLNDLLFQIAEKAAEAVKADCCSVFLYDPRTDELWTTVSTDLTETIRIPVTSGLAGACFKSGEIINLEDAYLDPRFNPGPDSQTGYRTRSLLSLPLFNRERETIGLMQLLNKKEGSFTPQDISFLQAYGSQAAIFLEMARLQQSRLEALEVSREELRRLNQVKDKALDHLSHELRTPLALIQGNVRLLRRKLADTPNGLLAEKYFSVLERNLIRLFEIQQEADKILRSQRQLEERQILEAMEERLERMRQSQEIPGHLFHHWQMLKSWMINRCQPDDAPRRLLDLGQFLKEVVEQIQKRAIGRQLIFELDTASGISWIVEPRALKEAVRGLVKNAVENTPDGGRILVGLRLSGGEAIIEVEDTGVGITPDNLKFIFDGLFPTQETDLYASKKPFDFNAGGKGLDLWRSRLAGQRYGFRLSAQSRRCRHLPQNEDLCPGHISRCPHCGSPEDCAEAGGSLFSLSLHPDGGI
ncbi:MAG: GAF domain-containing sensor histidine kinase [Deltaproteobacteria bacterium]|nr:GAF domain-containing sensor histidine kinase [Deltaproteobacteria bacterium]